MSDNGTEASESPTILGIAGSLRNGRWGIGSDELISSLKDLTSEDELMDFLEEECELHLENFIEAGRKEEKPFDEIYQELRENKGDSGLSNSEVTLASALWAAHQRGVDISHLSLAQYFAPDGSNRDLDELKASLLQADGYLISTPVYFGDRGSLTQSLIDFVRRDDELSATMTDKVHGGLAVGSKRNGGQETTLIYLLRDMLNLGCFGVGNDSETTSQYGGTGKAGDVGTMYKDDYGLETSMGTGRRVANVTRMLSYDLTLSDSPRILFLILQEDNGFVGDQLQSLINRTKPSLDATVVDITKENIMRCIACDFCPTHIDIDEEYRCIIDSSKDDLEGLHKHFLSHDAIVPVGLSRQNKSTITTNYQTFVERTRYLRRGDYVMSNWISAPILFKELGAEDNMELRMMTSMIRHNTILSEPVIGYLRDEQLINEEMVQQRFDEFVRESARITAARYSEFGQNTDASSKYNPTGYILSAVKDIEDERLDKREEMVKDRQERLRREAKRRLKTD